MAVGAGPQPVLAHAAGGPRGLGEGTGHRERARSRQKHHQAGQEEDSHLLAHQSPKGPARAAPLVASLSHGAPVHLTGVSLDDQRT